MPGLCWRLNPCCTRVLPILYVCPTPCCAKLCSALCAKDLPLLCQTLLCPVCQGLHPCCAKLPYAPRKLAMCARFKLFCAFWLPCKLFYLCCAILSSSGSFSLALPSSCPVDCFLIAVPDCHSEDTITAMWYIIVLWTIFLCCVTFPAPSSPHKCPHIRFPVIYLSCAISLCTVIVHGSFLYFALFPMLLPLIRCFFSLLHPERGHSNTGGVLPAVVWGPRQCW